MTAKVTGLSKIKIHLTGMMMSRKGVLVDAHILNMKRKKVLDVHVYMSSYLNFGNCLGLICQFSYENSQIN